MAFKAALEVPFEMIDYGVSSALAGAMIFTRTKIRLNAADFDGNPVFYFESIASNENVSTAYSVTLRDVTNSTDKASNSYAANTSSATRKRSTSFSPASGDVEYAVSIPQTAADNDVKCFVCRIIVVQDSTATKTVIEFPLGCMTSGSYVNTESTSANWDSLTSTSYGQGTAGRYARFRKNAVDWATVSGCAIDAVIRTSIGTDTCYFGLHDIASSTLVTGAEVSCTGDTNLNHVYQTFSWADMTNGRDFEGKLKATGSATARVYRASLRIFLSDLQKGEVFYRVGPYLSGTTGLQATRYRCRYTAANYSNPTCYFEAYGLCPGYYAECMSLYEVNADSGTGSKITGSDISFGTTKSRQRSPAISPTTTYRQFVYHAATGSDTQEETSGMLVIAFRGVPSTPTVSASQVGSDIVVDWS
jgi:hypothetical protein